VAAALTGYQPLRAAGSSGSCYFKFVSTGRADREDDRFLTDRASHREQRQNASATLLAVKHPDPGWAGQRIKKLLPGVVEQRRLVVCL